LIAVDAKVIAACLKPISLRRHAAHTKEIQAQSRAYLSPPRERAGYASGCRRCNEVLLNGHSPPHSSRRTSIHPIPLARNIRARNPR
jgi:hypothetical protein